LPAAELSVTAGTGNAYFWQNAGLRLHFMGRQRQSVSFSALNAYVFGERVTELQGFTAQSPYFIRPCADLLLNALCCDVLMMNPFTGEDT